MVFLAQISDLAAVSAGLPVAYFLIHVRCIFLTLLNMSWLSVCCLYLQQAERYRQEALALGSLHCSRVSVELKRARSNVRTAEIQSTIHEQR